VYSLAQLSASQALHRQPLVCDVCRVHLSAAARCICRVLRCSVRCLSCLDAAAVLVPAGRPAFDLGCGAKGWCVATAPAVCAHALQMYTLSCCLHMGVPLWICTDAILYSLSASRPRCWVRVCPGSDARLSHPVPLLWFRNCRRLSSPRHFHRARCPQAIGMHPSMLCCVLWSAPFARLSVHPLVCCRLSSAGGSGASGKECAQRQLCEFRWSGFTFRGFWVGPQVFIRG
jgi:hypothetical protein